MSITIDVDGMWNYIFTYKSGVYLNGKLLAISPDELDGIERDEAMKIYQEYTNSEFSNPVIDRIRSALYFAPYIETGSPIAAALMDTIVLRLIAHPELLISEPIAPDRNRRLKIYISDGDVLVHPSRIYQFPDSFSTLLRYDYDKLLDQLLKDSELPRNPV